MQSWSFSFNQARGKTWTTKAWKSSRMMRIFLEPPHTSTPRQWVVLDPFRKGCAFFHLRNRINLYFPGHVSADWKWRVERKFTHKLEISSGRVWGWWVVSVPFYLRLYAFCCFCNSFNRCSLADAAARICRNGYVGPASSKPSIVSRTHKAERQGFCARAPVNC